MRPNLLIRRAYLLRTTRRIGWSMHLSSHIFARLAAVALGVGLIGISFSAFAQEEERSFEQGIIHNIMTGLGGTNMENRGIQYRERSPLVIPPRIDLPPP